MRLPHRASPPHRTAARTEVRADAAQLAPDAEAASQQTVPLQEHSGWLGPDPAMMEREVLRHR